jgi:menaquinol-cytochrome c reductase iron-sulfur subunit
LEKYAMNDSSAAEMSRRHVLGRLSIALGVISAAIVGVPMLGFVFGPLFRRIPEVWRTVGPLEQFKVGETVNVTFLDSSPLPWAGVTAHTAAWLRRVSATEFMAFSVNCTHLGCPVRWLPDAQLFMCPCHGGVYNRDGTVAAGPPPQPLVQFTVRVHDGLVQIRTQPVPIV